MGDAVAELVRLSKRNLSDHSGEHSIAQSGGEVIDSDFALPTVDQQLAPTLPSIETFVKSTDGAITPMGTDEALTAVWMPAVEAAARRVQHWAEGAGVEMVGDAYITVSLTSAAEVNGEAHFDDDHFDPDAGAGLVAIVGDRGGPSVASQPIPHDPVRPHQPITATDQVKADFAHGGFGRVDYGPNQLVALPQFGQLHSGPGSCGAGDQVRRLLVFRASTVPSPRQL